MNGRASSTVTVSTPKNAESITIRRARLTEGYRIGEIAAKTYFDTPLSKYLSPHKDRYYSHYQRGFQHRAQARMLSPNNISFVACEATNPDRAIGYAQFARLGDDEGAKRQIKSRKSIWLSIFSWLFWTWTKIIDLIVGDKSADLDALADFLRKTELEGKTHWQRPERENRWIAQSVVILEEFQGKGIGKRLMREVIALAEAENVPVGLEASAPGRLMYESVGFDFLAPFQEVVDGDEGGGVMMYTPKAWKTGHDI